ncbi:MAG: GDP-mannose 4,6-dehydratase [Pseudomonadota bacterium]
MSVDSASNPAVLITGIEGFTGPYVASKFEEAGFDVHGLSNNADSKPTNFNADLADRGALQKVINTVKPQVVIHLAAISFVAHGDVGQIYQSNVVGTYNLLSALANGPVEPQAVILASSANVYGNSLESTLHEGVALSPANDYAVSKLSMEYMASLWFDRLPISVVRPFNYTGVGQTEKFLVSKIVAHYRKQAQRIELGNLNVSRDFSDVRFVAEAYSRLSQQANASGEIINICSGEAMSLQEIISAMNSIAGYEIEVDVNPDFVRANDVLKLVGSNEKLFSLVGDIERVPFINTLEWMYRS